jgi:hypothetical protein
MNSLARRKQFAGIVGKTITSDGEPIYQQSRQITVFKGEKKADNRPGKSLLDKYRVEIASDVIKTAFLKYYESLYPQQLNIMFPPDSEGKPEDVFLTSMLEIAAGGIQKRCNGQTIFEERISTNTPQGTYSRLVQTEKPCPSATTGIPCPSCKKNGELHFRIIELEGNGIPAPAILSVGSTDLVKILGVLADTYTAFGTLIGIPFILRRTKSFYKMPMKTNDKFTGAKANKEYWAVSLEIHPAFYKKYVERQRELSEQRVNAMLEGSIEVKVNALPPAAVEPSEIEPFYNITVDQLDELYDLVDTHWEIQEACGAMMANAFQCSWEEIKTIQFEDVKKAIANPKIIQQYEHAYKQKHHSTP